MCLDRSEGSVVLARQLHVVLMLYTAVSSAPATEADRMVSWRRSVAATEARKASAAYYYYYYHYFYFIFLRPPAQSLQAKNCKLGVTSEMAHSRAQKLLGCESVSERYFISSLQ